MYGIKEGIRKIILRHSKKLIFNVSAQYGNFEPHYKKYQKKNVQEVIYLVWYWSSSRPSPGLVTSPIRKLVFHCHLFDSYTEKPCGNRCFQSETIDLVNSETWNLVTKFFKDPREKHFLSLTVEVKPWLNVFFQI